MDSDILALIATGEYELACDVIIQVADDLDENDAVAIMDAVREIDPTFSEFGAAIRDTLRDNTELTVF